MSRLLDTAVLSHCLPEQVGRGERPALGLRVGKLGEAVALDALMASVGPGRI